MAERRWGRVTVEGWIEQAQTPGWVKVWTGSTSFVGPLATAWGAGGPVSVEFLPEPVTFKDGDVIRVASGPIWVREDGRWHSGGISYDADDVKAATWLRCHGAVRLVPEGSGG